MRKKSGIIQLGIRCQNPSIDPALVKNIGSWLHKTEFDIHLVKLQ